MADITVPDAFRPVIDHFILTARAELLGLIDPLCPALAHNELALIDAVGTQALRNSAWLRLSRLLLLELHAAKLGGMLTATDDAGRFAQFIAWAQTPAFAAHLDARYPPLRHRLQRLLQQQATAIARLAAHLASDRHALTALLGRSAGPLTALHLGQGDLHAGGQTVAMLELEGGKVMYKPRSLRVDQVLETFLADVFGNSADRVYVPGVIDCGDHGWAAFVEHRYCASEDELRTFYRGLGHWLAVLRLLGGTDIHLENLIAAGPVPVVIDVESLFSPPPAFAPSGFGDAYDLAAAMIRGSVLRTGIVPFRTSAVGLNGADVSAAGALPGEQPQLRAPIIVNEGTTSARLEIVEADMATAQNHPSPKPKLSLYWDHITEGFLDASQRLHKLDRAGRLEPLLARFEGCPVRDVRRATLAYVEIGRMLWHPASLHDEAAAIERARDLFERNAAVVPVAPSKPEEIQAEIDDLRYGDVPIFVAPLAASQIALVLADWRAMRLELEELTIRSALVATDLNQRMRDREEEHSGRLYAARNPFTERLEPRRRRLAHAAVERLLRLAVRGSDGSFTWITPEIGRAGWLVQPVCADLYFGLGGVAVVLAGYEHEVRHGRAQAVDGLGEAIAGALQVMQAMEVGDKPQTVGGFSGYGAQIWTWLSLYDVQGGPEWLARAVSRAEALAQEGFDGDQRFDIIDGAAGAIVPLLGLADATGDARWRQLAAAAARHLESTAIVDERGARWPLAGEVEPAGGFAHGSAGFAWALARLVLEDAGDEADRQRWRTLSDQAFFFQDALYDEAEGNWLDIRENAGDNSFHTWCNGSVGIGLAAADLYQRTGEARHLHNLRRAFVAANHKWGASHTLCHGDLSLWELLVRASTLDPAGCTLDRDQATAQIVSAIEEHGGMVGGLTRAAFTPGLMTGLAGAVHGLSRMHPDCTLASPLLLERIEQARTMERAA
ncbi:type 2 lanthipeptide synthetase LanM family protein [Dyella sp.]|uniref:type 2 lanthipeptide synthetase LanM family protein n=1 Tax=Dyella sp. TaxID=1869338 RepID=UPI003F7E84A0